MSDIEWKQGQEVWGFGGSPDEENWHTGGTTRQDAIEEGREYFPGESFWVIRGVVPKLRGYVGVDDVEDALRERLYDVAGDVGYIALSPDEKERLKAALDAWADTVGVEFWVGAGEAEEIEPEIDDDDSE